MLLLLSLERVETPCREWRTSNARMPCLPYPGWLCQAHSARSHEVHLDPIFDALTRRGLTVPTHSNQVGATIQSDNHYDQLAFFPGAAGASYNSSGVFDFDGALFQTLWNDPNRTNADFFGYMKYYISDHRILWAEFGV